MLSSTTSKADPALKPTGLTRDDLVKAFRLMYTSRRIDDREILLKRQNRIFFQISGAGHEAVQSAAGMALRPGYDWFYPYYRDRALCLTLGSRRKTCCCRPSARRPIRASGGRQMPSHWGSPRTPHRDRILAHGDAVPAGRGMRRSVAATCNPDSGRSNAGLHGDGATSEGEFWESLNIACLDRLPLLFLIEDNGYAISRSGRAQTAGGSISRLVAAFPGPAACSKCDGTDFLASYRAMRERGRILPRGQRTGAGACAVHPAVFALAVRRRAPVQDGGRARGRGRARSRRDSFPSG